MTNHDLVRRPGGLRDLLDEGGHHGDAPVARRTALDDIRLPHLARLLSA